MKKYALKFLFLFLAIAIFTAVLCGCKNQEKQGESEPPDSQEIVDKSGTSAIVLNIGTPVPVALSIDGQNYMEAGEAWYYDLQNLITGEVYRGLSAREFSVYEIGETTDPKIKSARSVLQIGRRNKNFGTIAINTGWETLAAMRHVEFDKKQQDKVDVAYKEYLRLTLDENDLTIAEVVVTDIYEYDVDGDGNNEAFVMAGDSTDNYDYKILAMLSSSLGNKILSERFRAGNELLDKFTAIPIIMDLEGDGVLSVCCISGIDYMTFEIYGVGESVLVLNKSMIIPAIS